MLLIIIEYVQSAELTLENFKIPSPPEIESDEDNDYDFEEEWSWGESFHYITPNFGYINLHAYIKYINLHNLGISESQTKGDFGHVLQGLNNPS